jgi:diguanylate cyclase (GGDEF)-like protein
LQNRKAFYENLRKELVYAGRYEQQRSLLFIDLDKFKNVNDQFGHETGDLFLKGFADRAGRLLRTTDNFYRLGGDEFVVILSEPHDHSPETVARRIIEAMKEPFQVKDATIDFVTASIGIGIFPVHGSDAETLLRYADRSMYRAKIKGNSYSINEY